MGRVFLDRHGILMQVLSPQFQINWVLAVPLADGVELSVKVMVLLTQPPGGAVNLTVGAVTTMLVGGEVYWQPFKSITVRVTG